MPISPLSTKHLPSKEEILKDYGLGCLSREVSLLGRKEVFMGRAKFGIFGDGKEVPQLAMARVFEPGDWRAGYYRDQTFMMAIGALTAQQFFAQLYGHSDPLHEPASSGRMMNAHFSTSNVDTSGAWLKTAKLRNTSADVSSTAAQMPRLLGLGYASKLYRASSIPKSEAFSTNGNEVAWGTIGDASTSEGLFWEVVNAAGVLQVPIVLSVWDDGYGISVPAAYHTVKGSISEALAGFAGTSKEKGWKMHKVKGYDYQALCNTYHEAAVCARKHHQPVFVHVQDLTQPQGHSTSGAHTRYKSEKRLSWEAEHDCLLRMRAWLCDEGVATKKALDQVEADAKEQAKKARDAAWAAFKSHFQAELEAGQTHLQALGAACTEKPCRDGIAHLLEGLEAAAKVPIALRADLAATLRRALHLTRHYPSNERKALQDFFESYRDSAQARYSRYLHGERPEPEALPKEERPSYTKNSPKVDGREVLQACFDALLKRDARFFAIGEDLGHIGGVNQAFAGLQERYGILRVTDTSIREASIVGQGIGAALRGLRPLVEVQYLDYMLYALQTLSDDLATLHYRTGGRQKAPLIIRTRGHRLEGIWHSGSPMGVLLHALRGVHVLVPRNMTQAAAFYNTLLEGDVPALLIECLNGYRVKEQMPENVATMRLSLGKPEVLKAGNDVTLLTYGALCRICLEASTALMEMGISTEVIDVQTLLPFDTYGIISPSLAKTNRLIIVDEDVPGGASAYILQQVLEHQQGYYHLDAPPRTLTAKAHRPAYGSDGNYFSKPSKEDVIEAVYALMHDDLQAYPPLYV